MQKLLATLTIVSMIAFTPLALADKDGHKKPDSLFSQLDLSDAQKEQIKTIRQNSREEKKIYREEQKSVRESFKAVMEAELWDESAVTSAATSEIAASKQLRLIDANSKNAVYNVLTAEQQAQLSELMEDRPERSSRLDKLSTRFEKLRLSDEQKSSVDALLATHQAEIQALEETLKSAKEAQRALVMSDNFDQSAWSQLFDDNKGAMVAARVSSAKLMFDLKSVLSKKQLKRLKKMMQKSKRGKQSRTED